MNDQETIDYWISACAAHETTIARLLEERAEARQEAQRMSENLNKSASFQQWWEDVGSGIRPLPGNDAEEHAKTVARSAWVACYAFFG